MKPAAVLSMLHESAERNSATRRFRNEPVLAWTLSRLARAQEISQAVILCWDDQADIVMPIGEKLGAKVFARGTRRPLPVLDAVTAARRWSDGWRGGLLQTCAFDLGFDPTAYRELFAELATDALLQINPAAGLIDPSLVDAAVNQSQTKPGQDIYFSPAAPGLGATLLTAALINRAAKAGTHPGRLLHYLPDNPIPDPISSPACVPTPTSVMRTSLQFMLDSDRQIERIARSTVNLNGQLIGSASEELVARVAAAEVIDVMPREVRIELCTERKSRPIYSLAGRLNFDRPPMDAKTACAILTELSAVDDIRITFAGVGDPMCYEDLFEVVRFARERGIAAISVETDLLADAATVTRLSQSGVDVVAVNFPAVTPAMYATIMGIDAYERVIENLRTLVAFRGKSVTPILVPVFTKCRENLGEMEAWYDHWLRTLGTAVIDGPSDYAGQIVDVAAADMTPPRRRACARLSSRMGVLCDGTIVACEQDVLGKNPLGRIGTATIADAWNGKMRAMRNDHQIGQWDRHPLCGGCREWHRP